MKTEKEAFQKMTVKEKIEHIWEYYKLAVLAVAFVFIILIYIIVKQIFPDPEVVLNLVAVNTQSQEVRYEYPDIFSEFLEEQGYNPTESTINLNGALHLNTEMRGQAAMSTYQAMLAMIGTGGMDLLLGDEDVIDLIGTGNGLLELNEVLPAEVLAKYEDLLYTVNVEGTGEQLVCGIRLPKGNRLEQAGYYEDKVLVGIPYSTTQRELAIEMVLYLLEQTK